MPLASSVIDLDWLQREVGYVLMPLQLRADKWINGVDIAPKLLHPMIHHRLEDELKAVAYLKVIDTLESYFLKPLEAWGLLEIERTKQGYFEVIQRIRKTEQQRRIFRGCRCVGEFDKSLRVEGLEGDELENLVGGVE